MAGLLLVLTACATADGSAVRGSTSGSGVSGRSVVTGTSVTTAPSVTTRTSAVTATTSSSGTTAPTSTSPPGPPVCVGTINRLATPTGEPMITVTAGANAFIANHQVEPLSLAVYADGTTISSLGVGAATEPLPGMTIGYIPECTLDWASQEIEQLATLDLGQPNVTDQGTTEVVYTPSSGPAVRVSAYALGFDDDRLMTGKPARARLTTLLAALRAPVAGASAWTPDALQLVEVPPPVESSGAALVWPVSTRLDVLLNQHQGRQRCGVVSGADAAAVRTALGERFVYSRWTDAGRVTGLNIGALVPGQAGCRQS